MIPYTRAFAWGVIPDLLKTSKLYMIVTSILLRPLIGLAGNCTAPDETPVGDPAALVRVDNPLEDAGSSVQRTLKLQKSAFLPIPSHDSKTAGIPSICRTCGKLIDRRSERRSKTVSCNEKTRSCTAAFNNNGKRRMVKRREWGRSFIPDEHFSYIAEYRNAVLEILAKQKANPDWPPYTVGAI